ncbi:MAG: hypothetical protein WC627_09150 [Legionella sp.]|jgi:hypothetical protein
MNTVGIGFGLYDGYGNAQKMYIARGYVPDGLGITYNYQRVEYGTQVPLDGDLVLWFTKKLKVVLITNNRAFTQVEGLKIEDWTQ